MSPEQLAGRSVDARTDIFAFGVVLYEMLTRQSPFAGDTDIDVMHAVVHKEPKALSADLPEALRTVVEKALEKNPADRYQSMRDLVVDLKRVVRRTAVPEVRASGFRTQERLPPANRSRWRIAAAAVLLVGVISVVAAVYFGQQNATEPARPATTSDRSALPNSVAVLPFKNLSPNEEDAYFAAGMHEEVLTQLAKLRNLSVISRTSVMRYVDTDLSVPEIARELKVGAVMEGSVRYAGDRVRITAQLIDADTDQHIWSDAYDRDLTDIFAIQADIAMNIADALSIEFSSAEQQMLEKAPTDSPKAFALYSAPTRLERLRSCRKLANCLNKPSKRTLRLRTRTPSWRTHVLSSSSTAPWNRDPGRPASRNRTTSKGPFESRARDRSSKPNRASSSCSARVLSLGMDQAQAQFERALRARSKRPYASPCVLARMSRSA